MELVMEIIKVVIGMTIGSVVLCAAYSTVQYFRLWKPAMKTYKEIGSSKEEA